MSFESSAGRRSPQEVTISHSGHLQAKVLFMSSPNSGRHFLILAPDMLQKLVHVCTAVSCSAAARGRAWACHSLSVNSTDGCSLRSFKTLEEAAEHGYRASYLLRSKNWRSSLELRCRIQELRRVALVDVLGHIIEGYSIC